MKKKKYIFLVVFLGVFILLFPKLKLIYKYYIDPCFYSSPVKQQDFPQDFLTVDLDSYYKEVLSLSEKNFKADTLQSILYQGKTYPILGISTKNTIATKKMLILAGVHGNESAGVLSVIELLKHYNWDPIFFRNWNIKIITAVNPVGLEKMSRYNECGCDLNRKISASKQKGIVLQREIIDSFMPNIVVSFHEAPSNGFLIHTNEHVKDQVLKKLLKNVTEKGIQLSDKDYFGRELQLKGSSKINGFFKMFNRLFKVDALGDYITPKGIAEITTESGWNTKDAFQRIQSHVFTVLSIVENYDE